MELIPYLFSLDVDIKTAWMDGEGRTHPATTVISFQNFYLNWQDIKVQADEPLHTDERPGRHFVFHVAGNIRIL